MVPSKGLASSLRLCLVVESGTDVRLIDGLAERFELTVLTRQILGGREITHPPATKVHTVTGPACRSGFAAMAFKYLHQHRKEIDLVLVQGYGAAALAANVAAKLTGADTVMLVCSPAEAYYRCRAAYPQADKPFRRRELLVILALAKINAAVGSQYVTLSNYLAGVIRGHGSRKPVNVIPVYGVNTKLFSPSTENKSVIKGRLGLPTTGSIIFFSSRIAPEKDSDTLLIAFRDLIQAGRDLWMLHRSGGYRSFIRAAERFGVSDRVIATDAVHPHRQLPQDYQASDLCVQASLEEGLGFSPLEALACGVPVIAAATGGLKETIVDGNTGWTYYVGDAEALARTIDAVLSNPVESARRAAAGREMVCANFDSELIFDRLEKLIMLRTKREPARGLAKAS